MALAGILTGDYKLYKAANYDGRRRMCKVLEERDERIKQEYEVKLKKKDAELSEKDAALSERDAEIERLKARLAELEK